MKTVLRVLQSLIVIAAIITIVGLSAGNSSKPEIPAGDCVKITKWVSCSNLCTDAKCFQFKNDCVYKVKITYKSKNPDASWTYSEINLNPGESSSETMICPYIEIKWSYKQL